MILFWWAPYPIHLFSLANFDAWCQNCDVYTVQWLRLRQMFSITCGSLLLMGEIWLTFKGWRWLTSRRSYWKCHHSQNFKIWERAWCIGCRTNLIVTHHFVRVSSPSCDSTMSWCVWLLFSIMAFESRPAEQAPGGFTMWRLERSLVLQDLAQECRWGHKTVVLYLYKGHRTQCSIYIL